MTTTCANPKWLCLALIATLLTSQASAEASAPELPNPGNAGMSRNDQIQLGFQAASQVYQQMPVLPDNSPETQYIRQLGQRLMATIPSQYSWPFEFHVIAQKEINAFALPGGPMFVNVGTITAATNEAELAGVMAHEMSHVYMQHSAKQAGKAQLTAGLLGLAGALIGATTGGLLGQLAQAGIQFTAQGLILKYSRSDEAQADAVGAIILYKAGYNPQALADFFQQLNAESGQPPQFLSDHPNPGNREAAIQKEIRGWPPKNYLASEVAFNKARQHALGVKVYTGEEIAEGAKSGEWAALNKKNGAMFKAPPGVTVNAQAAPSPTPTANPANVSLQSVLPSQRLITADLGPMKIAHPDNWQIFPPRRQGDSLTIAPQAGLASNAVGYGVIINGVSAPQGQRMSLDEITDELIRSMQHNGGVRPLAEAQPISIAGVQGRAVAMQSISPFPDANGHQQKERDWLVTVPRGDGTVLYLVFVAPQAEFERFRPTFDNMLQSAQF